MPRKQGSRASADSDLRVQTFKIEPFKHPIALDPNYAGGCWQAWCLGDLLLLLLLSTYHSSACAAHTSSTVGEYCPLFLTVACESL
jgi:hypothetical protein